MTPVSPVDVPAALCAQAQRVADGFTAATGVPLDATETITGRAALLGLRRGDRISAGGATRMLRGADTWCAITLSRPDDIAAVPALVEADDAGIDVWADIARWVAPRPAADVVARAQLLGIPAAVLGEVAAGAARITALGGRRAPAAQPLVVDLSSMWAGPLCTQLLRRAGATVIKVESVRRPDGTRAGPPEFFDWMNHGKLSHLVDFDDTAALRTLLSAADIVIEGSRPAALQRRGLGPDGIDARDGRIWLRITGYGTAPEAAHRVAFGDDAAVAGGLVEYDSARAQFVGDAIADPLTGLHAAARVVDALGRGGGVLIEMSMAATAAGYTGFLGGGRHDPVAPQRCPSASPLGADNATVHALLNERHSLSC
ncbi:CoA transferase [Mycobacterium sp. NPDC003323]